MLIMIIKLTNLTCESRMCRVSSVSEASTHNSGQLLSLLNITLILPAIFLIMLMLLTSSLPIMLLIPTIIWSMLMHYDQVNAANPIAIFKNTVQ